jgi:drug/metabolite transporter (DMT)-like permease
MAMDGPKALRDGRNPGRMATSSTQSAAFAMLCLIWGSTWLAIRIGLEGAPPFLSASLRFVVAAIVLLGLAAVFRSKWPQNRTEWALVAFVGIVLFTADYGLIYWGENNGVLSGLSAILFATFPLQTAVVANAFLREERFTVQKLLGIGVGFGGVVLIFRNQLGTAGLEKVFPMLAIVLAATCAAFATVAVKRWGHDTEPITFNAAAMAVGAAALAGVSLVAREPWAVPTWPQGLGAILYLGIAGSVVTFVAWQWLLKEMQATFISYIALIIPIVAVLLGASLGNETFDVVDLAGAGIVLLGIYVSTSRRAAAFARAAMGQGIANADPADPPPRKT